MTPSDTTTIHRAWKELKKNAELRKRAREKAQEMTDSFRKFIPAAWPFVEPSKAFIPTWHVDAIADHLESVGNGDIRNLLICVPPGSSKSLLAAVMFPAWMWTPGRRPGWRSIFASYASSLATRDSVRCRDLLKSIWFQETFEPTWRFTSDQDEKTQFTNSSKGFRAATSVTGSATGLRADLVLADDPTNAKERNSEAAITEVIDWWENVMFNRINLDSGCKVVIMQRLVDRDLAGHLLRKGGYESLIIPMEYDPARSRVTTLGPGKEWRDPRTVKGELMFPALFPQTVVDELKTNEGTYNAQYQQDPTPDGGGILKSFQWRYWKPRGLSLPPVRVRLGDGVVEEREAVELPDSFDLCLQSWDMAFKDLKTSDYVVGQVHGVHGANRFILDQIRKRLDFPATIAAVREMTGRWPQAHLKFVENKANGPAVVASLQDEISGMIEVNPEGSKTARAIAATPELQSGNWYLPHPMVASWVGNPENPTESGFLAETVAFPFGPNDDQVDSWSQGADRIHKEKIGGEFGITEASIRVDPFEFPPAWPRMYGLSITWREVGTIWLCRKPETSQYYAYAEYGAPLSDPSHHAAQIRKVGDWIPGVIHPEDTGRKEQDGYALVNRYASLGLRLSSIPDNSESELMDLGRALRAGELKVFGNLGRFLDQYRVFRRSEANGKLPQYNCGVIQALVVAWRGRDKMRSPDVPKPKAQSYTAESPANGWMGG